MVEVNRNAGFSISPRLQQLNITTIKGHHNINESYSESHQIDTYIQSIIITSNFQTINILINI